MGWFDPTTGSGADTTPNWDALALRKALGQALLQNQDDSNRPYTGLKNAGNAILGALLMRNTIRDEGSAYQNAVGSMIGSQQPNMVSVTPKVPDAQGGISGFPAASGNGPPIAPPSPPQLTGPNGEAVPNPQGMNDRPAFEFQPGPLGSTLGSDAAKYGALLKGLPPETGMKMLTNLADPETQLKLKSEQLALQTNQLQLRQQRGTMDYFRARLGQKPFTDEEWNSYLQGGALPSPPAPAESGAMPQAFDPKKFFSDFVAPHEGSKLVTDINGAPVKYGINQKYWPGEDIHNMTEDRAGDIFTQGYAAKAANLPAPLAAAYSDTAFLAGNQTADHLLQASQGDPQKYLALRQQYLDSLKAPPNIKAVWTKRTNDLGNYIQKLGPSSAPTQQGTLADQIGASNPDLGLKLAGTQRRDLTAAEAQAHNVLPGSQINDLSGEIFPRSVSQTPVSATDQTARAFGKQYFETGQAPPAMRDQASQRALRQAAIDYAVGNLGLTPEDAATQMENNRIAYTAKGHVANKLAGVAAQTAVNEGTVNNSINILRNLMPAAASRGQFTDLNAFEQNLARRTNDPNAANLKNAIDSISAEYARVLTGSTSGAPASDAARHEAAQRILLGYNNNTMDAVLKQMQAEMRGRSASYANVLGQTTGGTYRGPSVPFSGAPPAQSSNIIRYDANGNRIQ